MLGLLALGAVDACGSRSPLVESFEGPAGPDETGGSGGSLGGGVGGASSTGGDGYGGIGGKSVGYGGTNPTGAGGSYPMGTGGAYPTAGYGGVGVSVGGAYPMGVGGAYPAAGYGGKGMGVGGKGMGAGGQGGGGKGDPYVYKSCLVTCQKYDNFCAGPDSTCLADCVATGALYPNCSRELGDYLFCVYDEFRPLGECTPEDCSGPGCMTEAQLLCESALAGFTSCVVDSASCGTVGEVSDDTCRLTSYCGPDVYSTYCERLDAAGSVFECSCSSSQTGSAGTFISRSVNEVCYEMAESCGFPGVR